MEIKQRIHEENLKGHCCSEIIMNMALVDMGRGEEERRDAVWAMGAFCNGLHEGLVCGTLCAAKAALSIAEEDYDIAHEDFGPELMAWFKDRFGTWSCAELLAGDESRRLTFCPVIVEETYHKLYSMLSDIGAV